jgi:hypothetical protein
VDAVFMEQYPKFVDRARGTERPVQQNPADVVAALCPRLGRTFGFDDHVYPPTVPG